MSIIYSLTEIKEMILHDLVGLEAELNYLRWFKENADVGSADGDVQYIMDEAYTKETGRSVPNGWSEESDEG